MNAVWAYPFILVAGMLQAAGAAMGGELNKSLVNPWLATAISFILVFFLTAALFARMPRPLPSVGDETTMPWWATLGGIVAVFAGFILIQKLGAGPVSGGHHYRQHSGEPRHRSFWTASDGAALYESDAGDRRSAHGCGAGSRFNCAAEDCARRDAGPPAIFCPVRDR